MNDALKELFNAYKHLPVMVMFFKEGELFFVNDFLRSELSLDNLQSDQIVKIIGHMLELEEPTHQGLNQYLQDNSSSVYENHIYQIEHNRFDETDVYVLMRISDQTVDLVDKTHSIRSLREKKRAAERRPSIDEHEVLAQALGQWENTPSYESLVLYKGIPIKGQCEILGIEQGVLKIRVDKRQLIAASPENQWLVGSKKDILLLGQVVRSDLDHYCVYLEKLQLTSKGFNRRTLIRYEADENDQMQMVVDGKKRVLHIHDLSEKGIAVVTEDDILSASLSVSKTHTVSLLLEGKIIEAKASWLYTLPLDTKKIKLAFTIEYDQHCGHLLKEWMTAKQLHLIKEIRNFVQMVPPPKEPEPSHDWSI